MLQLCKAGGLILEHSTIGSPETRCLFFYRCDVLSQNHRQNVNEALVRDLRRNRIGVTVRSISDPLEHLVKDISRHILRIEFFVNSLKNEKYVTKRKYLEKKLEKK